MFEIKKNKSGMDILFLLVLFGVFAISGIFVVLFGVKIYKKTVADMDENFTKRTVSEYVTGKLQSYDRTGAVEIIKCEERDVLRLSEETEYGLYYTYLYFYNGSLREVTLNEEGVLRLKDGTSVIELDDFIMKKSGMTYYFTAFNKNKSETRFAVTLKSSMEV